MRNIQGRRAHLKPLSSRNSQEKALAAIEGYERRGNLMRSIFLAIPICIALIGCGGPNAPTGTANSTAPSSAQSTFLTVDPALAKRLETVSRRGQLIFELDRAAWLATDDLRAHYAPSQIPKRGGWIVTRSSGGWLVTFFNDTGTAPPTPFYLSLVRAGAATGSALPSALGPPTLDAAQLRMVSALKVAMEHIDHLPCTNGPYNYVVIPPESATAPIDVYILSPQVDWQVYPLGGHYLFRIAADGSVLSHRSFTRSCVNMSTSPEAGQRPVSLIVTHIMDPIPTEIHVFGSLSFKLPLYVVTSTGLWDVNSDTIRLVSRQ